MPFGPYSDFQDCVAKNADKASPEAFCAWLEHETTGNWPGELTHTHGMTPALRETFLSAFNDRMKHGVGEVAALVQAHAVLTEAGWQRHNGAWTQVAQHASLKSVRNVEIFKAGTWNGDTYSVDDLRRMVSAFAALHGRIDPPLKLGHSSDAFNQSLALKMGVAPEMLTGERGKGAIALGWVEALRLDDDTLVADFAYVPEGIASLIEQRGYRKISSEIMYNVTEDGVTYARVLAGVALLGAEIPAVSQIAGLETAAVYTTSREVQMVAEFDSHEPVTQEDIEATLDKLEAAVEPIIKHAKGAPTFRSFWSELKAKFKAIASKKQFGGEGSGNWGHGGRPGEIGGSAPGGGGGGGASSSGDGDKKPTATKAPASAKRDVEKARRTADRAAEKANDADAEVKKADATVKSAERLAERHRAAAEKAAAAGDPDAADLKAAADDADEIVKDVKAEAATARKAAAEADAEAKKALRAAMDAAKAEKKASYTDGVEEDHMDEHMKQIAKMMGMGEDAKPEDIVAAVGKMAGAQKAPAEMAKFTALEAENKTYAARVAELEAKVKAGERAQRVAHYTAQATKWTHLAGKPEEFAERLVRLEEVSQDEAAKLVAEYDRLDTQAAAAFSATGKPATGEQKHEFQRRFEKLMAEKGISEPVAYAEAMKADPELEKDYRRQNRPYSRQPEVS